MPRVKSVKTSLIKRFRYKCSINQKFLADKLEISQSLLSKWETAYYPKPKIDKLKLLVKVAKDYKYKLTLEMLVKEFKREVK